MRPRQRLLPVAAAAADGTTSTSPLVAYAQQRRLSDAGADALVRALYDAVVNPSSALWQNTALLRQVSADSLGVAWATPASIAVSPSAAIIYVDYARPSSSGGGAPAKCAAFMVRNYGGSTLIITSISPWAAYAQQYTDLAATATAAGGLPLTVSPAGSASFGVCIDPSGIPAGATAPASFVVDLAHNVPSGMHSVSVTVVIQGAPRGVPGDSSIDGILSSKGFTAGIATAYGLLLVLLCLGCVVYYRCCRRRSAGVSTTKLGVFQKVGSGSRDAAAASRPPRPVEPDDDEDDAAATDGNNLVSASSAASSTKGAQGRVHKPSSSSAAGAGAGAFRIAISDSDDEEGDGGSGSGSVADASRGGGTASKDKDKRKKGGVVAAAGSGAPSSDSSLSSSSFTASSSTANKRGGGGGNSSSSSSSSPPPLQLKQKPQLKASEFESKWQALTTVEVWGAPLRAPPASGELEKALAGSGVVCLASGTVGGVSKYYFFAVTEDDKLCMVEVSGTLSSLRLSAVIKASETGVGGRFVSVVKGALRPLLREEG